MSRRGICAAAAAVMLAGLGGCDSFSLNYQQENGQGHVRFVAGSSVESVSQLAQTTLEKMGVAVVIRQTAGRARFECTTKKGDKFNLVLIQQQASIAGAPGGVRIELENGPHNAAGLQILAALEFLNNAEQK